MTTVTAIIPARARGAVAAEWIKLRSVRSTYLALAAAAVAAIALGYLVTHYVASSTHWATMSPQARATWDPVSYSQGGLAIAQLAFGTLGVLVISSEHATGLIRTTFTATPWRRAGRSGGRPRRQPRPERPRAVPDEASRRKKEDHVLPGAPEPVRHNLASRPERRHQATRAEPGTARFSPWGPADEAGRCEPPDR